MGWLMTCLFAVLLWRTRRQLKALLRATPSATEAASAQPALAPYQNVPLAYQHLHNLVVLCLELSRLRAAGTLDPKSLLHDASRMAAVMPDREIFEKVAALREVAREQAAIGDRDGARASVDVALRTLAGAGTTGTYTATAVVDLSEASAAGDPLPTVSASNCMNWRKRPGPGFSLR